MLSVFALTLIRKSWLRLSSLLLGRSHDLIQYAKLVEHEAYISFAYFKHYTVAMVAVARLYNHCCALLVHLRLVAPSCRQVNLPVQVCNTISLVCCWRPNRANDICTLLLPEDWDRLFCLFSCANFPIQVLLELLFLHVERHDLA